MKILIDILLIVLLAVGVFFTFLGAFSQVKLRDFFQRVHGPTKASTLGVGCILVASIIYHSYYGHGFHPRELLIAVFLFLTAPVSAHMMGKSALHLAARADEPVPPPPGQDDSSADNEKNKGL